MLRMNLKEYMKKSSVTVLGHKYYPNAGLEIQISLDDLFQMAYDGGASKNEMMEALKKFKPIERN